MKRILSENFLQYTKTKRTQEIETQENIDTQIKFNKLANNTNNKKTKRIKILYHRDWQLIIIVQIVQHM